MPWVVLNTIKRVRERGRLVTYHPGDSIEVGKQTAQEWILDGSAYDPYGQVIQDKYTTSVASKDKQYGVRVVGSEDNLVGGALGGLIDNLQVSYGEPECTYPYTFIWGPTKAVSMQLLNYGWLRISEDNPIEERWEMAAMLVGIDKTLEGVPADDQTKQESLKVIGDLNVPVYEPRALWCRKTAKVDALLRDFSALLQLGVQPHHAFMRALYQHSLGICTLPKDWSA